MVENDFYMSLNLSMLSEKRNEKKRKEGGCGRGSVGLIDWLINQRILRFSLSFLVYSFERTLNST